MPQEQFDYYQLHREQDDWVVKGYGQYPKHSVNYGMTRIVFLDSFDTEGEARKAYPQLGDFGENYGSKFIDDGLKHVPSVAPDWFDEAAAGERWDDDY